MELYKIKNTTISKIILAFVIIMALFIFNNVIYGETKTTYTATSKSTKEFSTSTLRHQYNSYSTTLSVYNINIGGQRGYCISPGKHLGSSYEFYGEEVKTSDTNFSGAGSNTEQLTKYIKYLLYSKKFTSASQEYFKVSKSYIVQQFFIWYVCSGGNLNPQSIKSDTTFSMDLFRIYDESAFDYLDEDDYATFNFLKDQFMEKLNNFINEAFSGFGYSDDYYTAISSSIYVYWNYDESCQVIVTKEKLTIETNTIIKGDVEPKIPSSEAKSGTVSIVVKKVLFWPRYSNLDENGNQISVQENADAVCSYIRR